MHTVVVDIAIQGNSAKAPASHFHTVVPFHDLLTIWFSYGQIVANLRSGFWYIPFAFPAYVFTGYPYSDEKPALSYFQRTIYLGATDASSTTLFFLK